MQNSCGRVQKIDLCFSNNYEFPAALKYKL